MHNSPYKLTLTQQNNLIETYTHVRDDAANRADGQVVTGGQVCCVTQQRALQ